MEEQKLNSFEILVLKEQINDALRTVYDPEIPVNIFELGLIYSVDLNESGAATVTMTLTSPACPAAQSMPPEVKYKVEKINGVASAEVNVVWEPRWDPSMMSEAAKLTLGM